LARGGTVRGVGSAARRCCQQEDEEQDRHERIVHTAGTVHHRRSVSRSRLWGKAGLPIGKALVAPPLPIGKATFPSRLSTSPIDDGASPLPGQKINP
jgi:hypothetical protein